MTFRNQTIIQDTVTHANKHVRTVSPLKFQMLAGGPVNLPYSQYHYGIARISGREYAVYKSRRGRPSIRWTTIGSGHVYDAKGGECIVTITWEP